jgi:hypothetical protein
VDLPYQDLGAAGKAWVDECLTSERPWAIARRVRADGGLADGSVLGLGLPAGLDLPADVKLQYAPETYGFHLSQRTSGDVLLPLLARIEQRYGPCFLVVEADLLRPDDPYLRELPPGTVAIDGPSLYYIEPLADSAAAEQPVLLYGLVSTGYPLVAYILWETTPAEIADAFGRHDVGSLAHRVLAVVNSIFDDDGFSIWLPDPVRDALLGSGA